MSLHGRTAVVTGAARGIGRAMVEILLQNGAKVALLDVNKSEGESLKEAFSKQYGLDKVMFLDCDVDSDQQFKAAFGRAVDGFGHIDIMCNNAGILNEALLEKTISINLTGVIKGTYLALEHMNKLHGGRGGVIINTASSAGLGPFVCCPVYTATKHGVVGFTRAIAAASIASGYGVRVNAVCPGFVQTDLFDNIPSRLGQFSHMAETVTELVEKMGVINPTQVAESLLELVPDETKNGEALMVLPRGKEYMVFPQLIPVTRVPGVEDSN